MQIYQEFEFQQADLEELARQKTIQMLGAYHLDSGVFLLRSLKQKVRLESRTGADGSVRIVVSSISEEQQ